MDKLLHMIVKLECKTSTTNFQGCSGKEGVMMEFKIISTKMTMEYSISSVDSF